MNKIAKDYITEGNGKFTVRSHTGKEMGEYATKAEAEKRLKQIEYFKNAGDILPSLEADMEPGEMETLKRLFGKFLGEEEKEPEHGANDAQVAHKGYLIKSNLAGTEFYVSKGGSHIATYKSIEEAKKGINELVGGASDEDKFAAGCAFVTPDNRVLLLKRSDTEANYGGHWALPGGKAEEGESPEEAAKREAFEEIGDCNFDNMSEIDRTPTPNGFDFVTFLVRCPSEFKPSINEEHSDWAWTGIDELPEKIHPGVKATLGKLAKKPGAFDSLTPNEKQELARCYHDLDIFQRKLKEAKTKKEIDGWQKDIDNVNVRIRGFKAKERMTGDALALDKDSVRSIDGAGRMHVASAHISKATVNPYYGKEIPGFENLGLDPEHLYHLLRCPVELEKAASTFNGVQLLLKHSPVSAEDHRADEIVGTVGTSGIFNDPFLDNELIIWSQEGIDLIESGLQQELSCGYSYVPVMEPGVFNGERYDGRMTNIEGNHVALVSKGRAGPEVIVGDEAINLTKETQMTKPLSRTAVRVQAALSAYFLPKIALDSMPKFTTALGAALVQVNRKTFAAKKMRTAIVQMAKDAAEPMLSPEAKKAGVGPDDVIMRVLDMVEGASGTEPEEMDEAPEKKEGEGEEDYRKKVSGALADKGMDEAGIKEIMDMMPGALPASEAKDDKEKEDGEDETPEEKEAREKKEKAEKESGEKAMDAAIKIARAGAVEDTMKRLTAIRAAERAVLPLIGEVSIAMDSADKIYEAALKAFDVDISGVDPSAYPALVSLLVKNKEAGSRPAKLHLVGDSASSGDREEFDKKYGITPRPVRNLGA